MRYESIADIYSANQKIREYFTATVSRISMDEASVLPEGEKWTIQQIAEHVAMVDIGAARICSKLLNEARTAGNLSEGGIAASPEFSEKLASIASAKFEAPERVQPTGTVTISEAVERMKTNVAVFEAMRCDLEKFDLSKPKFPHPFFGDMTATEWLIVAGAHEMRHTKQIERLLEKIRQ